MIAGAIVGVLGVAASVGAKTWQDRDMLRPSAAIAKEIRREARLQRKVLGPNRVGRGVPAGGQFAARAHADADVDLGN